MPDKNKNNGVEIPADLSVLSADDLTALEQSALDEVDRISGDPNIDAAGLARLTELADGVELIRGETGAREQAAAELAAGIEAQLARVRPAEAGEDAEAAPTGEEAPVEEAPQPALVAGGRRPGEDARLKDANKLNIRLSEAARVASQSKPGITQPFDASVLIASADIPGFATGSHIDDMTKLVEAYQRRAKALPIGRALAAGRKIYDEYFDPNTGKMAFGLVAHEGDWRTANKIPIASLEREFRHKLDPNSSPETMWNVMQQAARPDALVAAGGWCSPSEIRYDFYNIVGMDGALDLPTAGINRGGMRWPTSPSFGDLAASTGLWHWTETQDIAAATGTAQSGTKTCARVPCAAFNEARLEGEGICITAGNLTTDAWPEQISNFLRLVNAAHFHRINAFFINGLIANSTAVTVAAGGAGTSATSNILAAIEHQVWDLRTKYAMADTDVLEAVFPSWVVGIIRADMSRRSGFDSPDTANSVTNAQIASWFTERYIRVQFVQDFDVRGAGQFGQAAALTAAWPTTVRFLLYPAGTWLRGNGLSLDLGIIRDSTLNATNDYTAAWSEEFFLLAKIGHESRIVTVANVVPTGSAGVLAAVTGV